MSATLKRRRLDFGAIKRVPMREVLARYDVRLKPSGRQLIGGCPLPTHAGDNQRDPFKVTPGEFTKDGFDIFHCFSPSCVEVGKNAGGNCITFVQAMEGFPADPEGYYQAAELLNDWFGIQGNSAGPRRARSRAKPKSEKGEVVEAAAEVINPPLTVKIPGFSGLQDIQHSHWYLEARGFSAEICEAYGVGYFPGKGSMAGRIVFPIHNTKGELIGYAGRLVVEDDISEANPRWRLPKGFHSSHVLYNLHRVLWYSQIIVVEGCWGVLACARAGFPNAVALLGSTASAAQITLLSAFMHVTILLDGDDAGRAGTRRLLEQLVDSGGELASIYRIELPLGAQPDLLTPDELNSLLKGGPTWT